jgi:hypothetical protein
VAQNKPLTSCFDCVLLQYHPRAENKGDFYFCGAYRRSLSYDIARTPNDCPKRVQEVITELPREEVLDRFFMTCKYFAIKIGRPFTMRELFEEVDYLNKNSLWELLEHLVKSGKLEKGNGKLRTWRGQVYPVKTYFPARWEEEYAS